MNPTLQALINTLIPADEAPSGWQAGVGEYLLRHATGDLATIWPQIEAGLHSLEGEAKLRFDAAFSALSSAEQTQLISEIEGGQILQPWSIPPQRFLQLICNLAAEGYYADPANGGNRDSQSWQMVGYRAGPNLIHAHSARPPTPAVQPLNSLQQIDDEYDAIVIGAGAAGGILACVLAEVGRRVLLVERGRWLTYDEVGSDHLRNHRLALYGHNTGPELLGNPRIFVDDNGLEQMIAPHENGYHNNAMTVGGGTRVYGAQAWRFLPEDFRMKSIYGQPADSSLADWPISYEEMAPYYERAEWQIGVSGADVVTTRHAPRQRGYPMPAVPDNPERLILGRGAAKLGWQTAPVPLLINSIEYQNRPGCVQCGQCVGFACPSESKNGTHNTVIPRALATGNCSLLCEGQVGEITTDQRGQVTGVRILREENGAPVEKTVRAAKVIVAAGAIESARLLLNSRSAAHPQGLGNRFDQVGRNLQGHVYTGAHGLFDEIVHDDNGPGVSIHTSDFNHGNPGIVGGGMLANEFTKLPIIFWRNSLPAELPRWGQANKDFMRHAYRRTLEVFGPIQEIPNPECRVTVAPMIRDHFGVPVARLSGVIHPESLRTAEFHRQKAVDWLTASGAIKVWQRPLGRTLSAGQHQAGTCRMGDDPHTSVTDRWGRVHDQENLYVIDGSLHVTNGGFNPVLTIMALAFRCAEHLL